jgi:hypothetical protein
VVNKLPVIDYTSRDFEGLKSSLLAHARDVFPEWQPASEGDLGVLLLEMLAYVGDITNYYVDQSKQEAYLPTATQRQSVLNIADMLGYLPHSGVPATATVTLESSADASAIIVPAGSQLVTDLVDDLDAQIVFETIADATVPAAGGTVVVAVQEGETHFDVVLGSSDGQADQTFRLPHTNVYTDSLILKVDGEQWRFVPHLLDAEPQDKVFAIRIDAENSIWVRLGDGINGAAPAIGTTLSATYRSGFGVEGNVGAAAITQYASAEPANVFVSTDTEGLSLSTAATGGADPESTEQIRVNAPRSFRTVNRAITTQDFEDLAITVPGVVRARAIADFFTSVSVYILGPGGNAPNNALIVNTLNTLSDHSLAGTTVSVAGPIFIPINVGATLQPLAVEAYSTFTNTSVKFAVEQTIRTLLSPTNLDFGIKLAASDFYSAIMSVPGVRYVSIPMLARNDATQVGSADIICKPWEFPTLGNLVVTVTGGVS